VTRRKRSRRRSSAAARRHTRQRASERFAAGLTSADYTRLVRMVQLRQGRQLPDSGKNRELWLVRWQGQHLPVVYDTRAKVIVSVLPPEHEAVAPHIAQPEPAPGPDPRLNQLRELAGAAAPDTGPVKIGGLARHLPSGCEGVVLDADMERRTLTIRVGSTGRLEDRLACFDGPAFRNRS